MHPTEVCRRAHGYDQAGIVQRTVGRPPKPVSEHKPLQSHTGALESESTPPTIQPQQERGNGWMTCVSKNRPHRGWGDVSATEPRYWMLRSPPLQERSVRPRPYEQNKKALCGRDPQLEARETRQASSEAVLSPPEAKLNKHSWLGMSCHFSPARDTCSETFWEHSWKAVLEAIREAIRHAFQDVFRDAPRSHCPKSSMRSLSKNRPGQLSRNSPGDLTNCMFLVGPWRVYC